MSLPRRVPWSSQEEYEEVFNLLFSSGGDLDAQRKAVDRIHVWQSRGCCPYAAEASASILAVIARDASTGPASTSAFPEELRLAYAMALTRFVNGLVDPAQQGPFARSIAAIAAQIGLPLWFVELRHASTHEDLPSLQVLRDAARKAMDWLYQRYWLAQMQSASMEAGTTVSEELSEAQKVEITGLLTQYKKLKKETLRDASVSKQKELARLTQAIERWTLDIGTSRASFSGASGNNLDATAIGCQALARVLAEAGFLVPMSKKKRPSSRDTDLPQELKNIWAALLEHLDDIFEDFSSSLLWHCLEVLASATQDSAASNMLPSSSHINKEKSYLNTVKLWVVSLLPNEEDDTQEDIMRFCLLHNNVYTAYVLSSLVAKFEHLAGPVKELQRLQRSQPALIPLAQDNQIEQALFRISERIDQLHYVTASAGEDARPSNNIADQGDGSKWSFVPEERWKPCPFGMLPGGLLPSLEVA